MASYLFEDPFGELVATGHKTQTIRRLHPDLPKVGDTLQLLRYGAGAKTIHLTPDPVCTSVQPIRIYKDRPTWTAVELDGEYLILVKIRRLALADGFASTMDFLRYFERKGLPFDGVLIRWEARPESPHTPPPVRECRTCKHDGNSIEDWPCRVSLNAAGLTCYEPMEDPHGAAST